MSAVRVATAPASAAADRALCNAALPHVSRTFALCIRFLPDELEYSVLVAYLLCRIADTIEDSASLAPDDQRRLLESFRDAVLDPAADISPLEEAFADATSHEERLARNAGSVLREFGRLPPSHRAAIAPWVREMCDGMAEFATGLLRRPQAGGAAPGMAPLRVLPNVASLERYCWFVAGTVGHLLSELFRLRFTTPDAERDRQLEALAASFGLGLQLTNIVKDVTADRERGVSFVPRDLCAAAGVDPEHLTDPARRAEARRVLEQLAVMARAHLDDAIAYCTALPAAAYGIRRFCLVSVFLAARTLALLPRDPHLLEPGHTVKVTRADVARTVLVTSLIAPSNALVRRYYRALLA